MAPCGLGGHSMVPHGDVAPVRWATVLLGTKIFPVGENLATLETVPRGTAALDTAMVADVGVPPEMLHPDDFPTEAESLPDPLPGPLSSDILLCTDQRPVGGVPIVVLTGMAGDKVRSVGLRHYLQWLCARILRKLAAPVERMAPPGVGVPTTMGMLQQEVDLLLAKQAIERVHHPESLGFYSRVFLAPKKNGKLRPVINLCPLNQCILCPHFQMETVASISSAIRPGDWATSLDLTDAYFHVPIAPWFRKYLHFVVNSQIWQFQVLPFGLSTAP